MTYAKTAPMLAAVLLMALPLGPAAAQADPAEVLCPVFIPEAPAKHCVILTGDGCVIVIVSTFGNPSDPDVFVNTCMA